MNSKSHIATALFLLFLGSITPGKAFPDDQISTIINRIRQRYGNKNGLNASYTREAISKTMVTLGLAERHDVAKGRLYFKPPHSFRLEQNSPKDELLITDGQTLWWYIPQKKEAYRYAAEKFGKELRLLSDVLQGLKGAKDNFQINYRENPVTNTHQLILRPEPSWQDIDHLEVVLGKADIAIAQVDIFNTIGGLTRFLFTDWQENVPFREGFFRFSPPSGIKIIEK